MAQYVPLPDGTSVTVQDGETPQQAWERAKRQYPEAFAPKPAPAATAKSGFMPAFKAGVENLKGDIAGLAGRAGIMDLKAAEDYRAAKEANAQRIFKPTEDNWIESPLTKALELAGGSAPYMVAPVVAGGAATLAGAPALAATGLAGAASMAQFTGSNLSRQVDEGKKLGETDLQSAALAAAPQAVLDMVSFKMMPGIRNLIFKQTGKQVSKEAAQEIAKQGLKTTLADYAKATGKTMTAEGLTEAGQQVFERMQAGLNLTDPEAQKEYWDNFLGGAVLGGVLAPAGHAHERSVRREQEAKAATAKEQAERAAALQAQEERDAARRAAPGYLDSLEGQAQAYVQQFAQLDKEAEGIKDADPVVAANARAAAEKRKALESSDEYQAHLNELGQSAPALAQFRAEKKAAADKAAADEAAAKEAALNDPVKQAELWKQRDALQAAKTDADLKAKEAFAAGDLEGDKKHSDYAAKLQQQLEDLTTQLGPRPVAQRTLTDAEIQQGLEKLNKQYTEAKAKKDDTLLEHARTESARLRNMLDERAALAAQAGARTSALAEQEGGSQAPSGPIGPRVTHPLAPTPVEPTTNDRLRSTFGATTTTENLPAPQATGERARVPGQAPAPVFDSTAMQQDALFGDMEPGGSGVIAGEEHIPLLAQIDKLRQRPNMPAQTLAQLDRYADLLKDGRFNDAIPGNENVRGTTVGEMIAENLRDIDEKGYGSGVKRAATRDEIQQIKQDMQSRIDTLRGEMARLQQEYNAPGADKFALGEEMRDKRTRIQQLVSDQRAVGIDGRITDEYRYNQRPVELVGEMGKRGKALQPKTASDLAPVNAMPETRTDTSLVEERDPETGEVVNTRAERTERAVGQEVVGPPGRRTTVERGGREVTGVAKAGPSDAALNEGLLQISPQDAHTLSLFDPVFGEGSKARNMVLSAEKGLQAAENAVRETQAQIIGVQYDLRKATEAFDKAVADLPETQALSKLKATLQVVQDELGAARERGGPGEDARGLSSYYDTRVSEARRKADEAQGDVARLNTEIQRLEKQLATAVTSAQQAWASIQQRGVLTPEQVAFFQQKDLAVERAQAEAALADVLAKSTSERAQQAADILATLDKRVPAAYNAQRAENLRADIVRQVTALMGPRAGTLADTLVRLRIAQQIVGKAVDFAKAAEQASGSITTKKAEMARAAKVADTAMSKYRDATLSRETFDKATAKWFSDTEKRVKQLNTALEKVQAAAEKAADKLQGAAVGTERAALQQRLSDLKGRLQNLTATEADRVHSARTNLNRAKQALEMAIANQQALNTGAPLPVAQRISALQKKVDAAQAGLEQALRSAITAAEENRADAAGDVDTLQAQLAQLGRAEKEIGKLFADVSESSTAAQEQLATMLESVDLLYAADELDENGLTAVSDSGQLKQALQQNAAAEATWRTHRDAALKTISTKIAELRGQVASGRVPLSGLRSALDQIRALERKQWRTRSTFDKRIGVLQEARARMTADMQGIQQPAAALAARKEIANLQSIVAGAQQERATLDVLLQNLRKRKEAIVSGRGRQMRETLGALGVDVNGEARKQLLDLRLKIEARQAQADKAVSEAQARVDQAAADAQNAYVSLRFAHAGTGTTPEMVLDAREAYRSAREAYDAALGQRAALEDEIAAMERQQLAVLRDMVPTAENTGSFAGKGTRTEAVETPAVPTTRNPIPAEAVPQAEIVEREKDNNQDLTAFQQRIDASDNAKALRQELGALQAQHDALINDAEAGKGRRFPTTLTTENAEGVRAGAKHVDREIARRQVKGQMVAEARAVGERMNVIKQRLRELARGSVSSIVKNQPSAARRGQVERGVMIGQSRLSEGITKPLGNKATLEKQYDALEAQIAAEEDPKKRKDLERALKEVDARLQTHETREEQRNKPRSPFDILKDIPQRKGENGAVFRTAPATGAGLEKAKVQSFVERIVESWTNKPETVVVQSTNELPQHLQDQMAADEQTTAPGMYDPATGKVYLVADNLHGPEDVALTIAHEITGHYGLRDLLGGGYAKMMDDIYNSVPEVRKLADEKLLNSKNLSREVAVEEVLADRAETQPGKTGIGAALSRVFYAIKAAIRNMLGKAGFKPDMLRITDAEVRQIVANARAHVKRGTPGGPKGGVKAANAQTAVPAPAYRSAKMDTTSAAGKFAASLTAQPVNPLQRMKKNAGLSLEMWGVDMRAPLVKALGRTDDKTMTQASYYVRKADALMNHVYAALGSGPLQLVKDGKGFFKIEGGNGPSMTKILDAIGKVNGMSVEDKMAKAQAYLVARRAQRVGWDKLNFDVPADMQKQAADMMREINADPAQKAALEHVADLYGQFNSGMVQFLADSGYLSKNTARELTRHGDYVPFYRVKDNGSAELVMGENAIIHIGDLRNNKFLATLEGDNQKLLPLNEAMIRNTMLLTDLGMKNLASKDVAYAMQKLGVGKIRRDVGEHAKGPDVIHFRQEPMDANDDGKRYIRISTNGTALEDIPSEMLVQSLEGSFSTLPAFLKGAAWFGDLLRSGVTRNPMYIARQLVRDPMSATFTGGLESGIVGATMKSMKNFVDQSRGTSKEGADLLRKGLVHSNIFTGDVDDIKKIALQLASGEQSAFTKTLAWWDKAAMNADAATRIQLYKDALGKGMSEVEAEFAAMEMMNFNKRGMSPSVQYAARMIPFLNAQIQGLNVLFKAMTGNMPQNEKLRIREKFYRRALTMTAFTLAYAMAMDDDDTYKNARPRDRYNNWFLPNPTGGEHIKIPIPFEVGLLFKTVPEAVVDMVKGDLNKQEWEALRGAFINQIPGAQSAGLPQAIKPAIEVVANHNFFTGREIESHTDRQKASQERFGPGTTEIAKELSKAFNAMGMELSPKQIDHLVSGYLGSMPVMVARLTNSLFDTAEGPVRAESQRASDNPVYGSLFQKESGGKFVDFAYDQQKALDEAKKTYDSMMKEGRKADAAAYKEDVTNVLASEHLANRWKAQNGVLTKQEQMLRRTVKDPEVLAEKLQAIEKRRNEISKLYFDAVQQIAH